MIDMDGDQQLTREEIYNFYKEKWFVISHLFTKDYMYLRVAIFLEMTL